MKISQGATGRGKEWSAGGRSLSARPNDEGWRAKRQEGTRQRGGGPSRRRLQSQECPDNGPALSSAIPRSVCSCRDGSTSQSSKKRNLSLEEDLAAVAFRPGSNVPRSSGREAGKKHARHPLPWRSAMASVASAGWRRRSSGRGVGASCSPSTDRCRRVCTRDDSLKAREGVFRRDAERRSTLSPPRRAE